MKISKAEVKPGDVILIHLAEQPDHKMQEAIHREFLEHDPRHSKSLIIFATKDQTIESLDEEAMERQGWVRASRLREAANCYHCRNGECEHGAEECWDYVERPCQCKVRLTSTE